MNDFETLRPTAVTDPTTAGVPLVDLEDITPDESLLADVRKTRITTPVTRALLALVVIGAAVLGGAMLERSQHKTSSSSGAQSLIAQIRAAVGGGASGASGASGSGGAAALFGRGGTGGSTIGTVKLVDGNNVYVQDLQGNTVKVTTSPTTKVTISKTGSVSQLAPGSTVIVQGKQNKSGTSMSATSISPSTGFGGGGFPGGGGSGGPAAGAG